MPERFTSGNRVRWAKVHRPLESDRHAEDGGRVRSRDRSAKKGRAERTPITGGLRRPCGMRGLAYRFPDLDWPRGGAAAMVATTGRWLPAGNASRLRGGRHRGDVGGDSASCGEQGFDGALGPGQQEAAL